MVRKTRDGNRNNWSKGEANLKPDVILEFTDGRSEEAVLTGTFMPEQNVINVLWVKTNNSYTFFLNRLCCIRMKPIVNVDVTDRKYVFEEVTTVTGKQYYVAVLEDGPIKTGFYGYSMDMRDQYRLIFFPAGGVKMRRQKHRVGEMLRQEGILSRSDLDETLEEQRALREKRLGEIIAEKEAVAHEEIERVIDDAYEDGTTAVRMKVGDILIEAGLVTREQVEEALSMQEVGKRKKIGSLLIEKGLITEKELLTVLAAKFLVKFVDLYTMEPPPRALNAIPVDVIYRLNVFPIEDRGNKLVVATSDPADYAIPDTLRFYTRNKIELVVALSKQIAEATAKYYPRKGSGVGEMISEMAETPAVETETEEIQVSESDSQIVTLVNKILLDAYNKGASDIHLEPGYRSEPFQVRYRIDGVCRLAHEIPKTHKQAILSRIKIMSNLDISERRKPQSGKILIWHQNKQIEFRVETTPTVGGNEDAVLRILTSSVPLSLDEMGFSAVNLEAMKESLSQPYGIILCVGPTGSGKTTTLHSALKHLNTSEVKIWTVEDPVEITQKGLRQVQVQPKIGLTFHEALRSFLRADPDVIMVGEMRDEETVRIAIEASLTGHLVLSTLHTNSAPETIVRLIDMGMDPFNFADALLGVLAQRLARRLCQKCKEPYQPDREEFERLVEIYDERWYSMHDGPAYSTGLTLMRRVGCEACDGTGYKGRIAIHEFLVNTEAMNQLIRHRAPVEQLRSSAITVGMRTLLMDGIQKVLLGLTDLSEVLQVCRYEKKINTETHEVARIVAQTGR
jgi:type II secretory ATPase GspE/PulE/Tfp pilus assembly ATPase PilB-like protein